MSQTPWRVIGGPPGAHTAPQVTSVAGWARLAVLLSALPVLAALALRGWCLSNGWGGQAPLWRACYSDLPSALTALRGGGEVSEPVVTALALRLVAAPVRADDASAQSSYVLVWALVSLVLLAVIAVATAAYRLDDPSRALLVVLCPVLPLTLLLSAEILGVALAVLALLAWRRRLDAAAGLLLALAVFSRSYALILVVVLLAIAVRSGRSPRSLLLGLGAGGAAIVGAAALFGELDRITGPVQEWWDAVPSYGSIWLLPSLAGQPLPTWLTPWLVLAGWVAAAALVLWHVATARRIPAIADLALLGVAAVLVTGSAVPVQASLWLVPLVALSSLPWRDMLVWAAAEVVYYPMVWLYLGGLQEPDRGLPAGWYSFFLLLRLAAIGYLMWRVVDLSAAEPGSGREPAGDHDFLSGGEKGRLDKGTGVLSTASFSPQGEFGEGGDRGIDVGGGHGTDHGTIHGTDHGTRPPAG